MKDDEQYFIVNTEIDGWPLIGMIRTSASLVYRPQFPWILSISTPLFAFTADGLPSSREVDELNSWENVICASVCNATPSLFMGRTSWRNYRELLHYIKDAEPATTALELLTRSGVTRPFAYESRLDADWDEISFYWTDLES